MKCRNVNFRIEKKSDKIFKNKSKTINMKQLSKNKQKKQKTKKNIQKSKSRTFEKIEPDNQNEIENSYLPLENEILNLMKKTYEVEKKIKP